MASKIKCPHCGEEFELKQAEYQDILKQVRDKEFEENLKQLKKSLTLENDNILTKNEAQHQNELKDLRNEYEKRMQSLESKSKLDSQSLTSKFEKEIQDLKNQLAFSTSDKELALASQREQFEGTQSKLNDEIKELKGQIQLKDILNSQKVKDAVKEKEDTISDLKHQLQSKENEQKLNENILKENFDKELKRKDDEIAYYKDYRNKLSTKGLGEDLEKWCHDEFNKIRSMAFPNAYFEKDNDASSGTKGDFIFRENDEEGNEILSIMFDMKNEATTTVNKKTNESHFQKLDKDRNEKKCEYAVLVSTLEAESDYYSGITQVYQYPKMYVVRPNFFVSLIGILRNNALNNVALKREVLALKNQNIDVTNFEDKLNDFKDGFMYNVGIASKRFDEAIDNIDKSIKTLMTTKDKLLNAKTQLEKANDKVQGVTIKKLTRGNATMKEKLEEGKKKD